MPGTPRTYYKDFVDTAKGFSTFHNQVINMPRDAFDGTDLLKLQVLASYLLLIQDTVNTEGNDYKQIMNLIADAIPGNRDKIKYQDAELERKYFTFTDINTHYDDQGRMFRHLMGYCSFWGMIKSLTRNNKTIDFSRCKDFVELQSDQVIVFTSNISLSINIKDNDFINNLRGVDIKSGANYRPTLGILKYLNEIGREASDFELSILLGRVNGLQDEGLIIQRALEIGRWFSATNRNGQQQEFFREMGWVDDQGNLFTYSSSQQPWFKFQTYLIFLSAFGLIQRNNATGNYSLTESARELLGDLPASVIDLNKIINKLDLDRGSISDTTMKDVLVKANIDALRALVADQELIRKINKFVLANPIIKKGVRVRNQFIAELARIRENYQCQAGTITFERQDGRNYVEAHHIIEFSKNGPDILENLLALGPTPHTQLHRGSERAKRDMYIDLISRGAIRLGLFESMIDEYNCLDSSHLDFLHTKGIISNQQKVQLQEKLVKNN